MGKWLIGVYYYADYGQLINGPNITLTVKAGQKVPQNLSVAFETPAAARRATLTGAPKDFNQKAYIGVQGCPGTAFKWRCKGGTEAYENIAPGQPYSIDPTPGKWMIAAYYHPRGSTATFIGKPVAVTSTAGKTATVNVMEAYQGL